MPRLLLVEDNSSSAAALAALLRREGFDVSTCTTAADALREFDRRGADMILLDQTLPDMTGLDLCLTLRARSDAGILIIGAGNDREDAAVAALDRGADDYLAKPYGLRELVARIRALLRRCAATARRHPAVIAAGPIALDPAAHTATLTGRPLDLPLKEFQLLETFVRNPGRTLARDQLLGAVWDSVDDDSNTLNVHVKRLRAKIEPDPAAPRHLVTVRGIGYKYLP
ncbi:response regulator transcription factor [Dactylosporangium sp. McL0621]|uniref:response regulator transcription factor n=1 Tax=Dactylosporangium sp. McL0621 TaxID=3415678 RepID=UPI003CEF71C0